MKKQPAMAKTDKNLKNALKSSALGGGGIKSMFMKGSYAPSANATIIEEEKEEAEDL